jgi:hypothetical protein
MSDLRRRFAKPPATDSAFVDPHRESYDPMRTPFTLPIANVLSSVVLPGLGLQCPGSAPRRRAAPPQPK